MKHTHKDSVPSLLWNICTVLSVWAVPRPQWMCFTPAPCFHTSGLVFFFFWWYMEFYRTSFTEGSNFYQNLSKMLFHLGAFPPSTSWLFQSLAQVTENTVINIYTGFLGKDAVIFLNLLQKHPKPGGFFLHKGEHTPAIIYLRSAWTKVCHAHKYMGDALSWCFKKLSQRLWSFYSTRFYNLKITTCSYSGTRILEKEESAHSSLFCYFTNYFFKIFKTMLISILIKDWSVLTSPGFALP